MQFYALNKRNVPEMACKSVMFIFHNVLNFFYIYLFIDVDANHSRSLLSVNLYHHLFNLENGYLVDIILIELYK